MRCTCKQCQASFEITDDDLAFYDRVSPVFSNKKYAIPPPTHCPDCRQQRRIAHCNERYLYSGECQLCKTHTLTQYSPTFAQPVYCRDCWHSDKWDARKYGRDFDFSHPFFEQLSDLRKEVPSLALDVQGTLINSDYIHYAGSSKNCYLIMHADFCEDCYYGYGFKKNKSCVDGFYNLHSELLYDCVDCHHCYDLKGCQDCQNCHSSAFLRDCTGCSHCFLCTGLKDKTYCFENEQLSREEYQTRIQGIDLGSYVQYQQCKSRRRELELHHPFKEFQGHQLENCSGNHLYRCKDVHHSFDCEDVEYSKFCYQVVLGGKFLYDVNQYGTNIQESLECLISGEDGYHLLFTFGGNINCSDLLYCWYMENSKNCFACASMHHASYCIFNKQYTKEEYESLVPKIINRMQDSGDWGEFFPLSITRFGYNKTTAQLYYPLSQEQARSIGAQWDDYEPPAPSIKKTVRAEDLPDSIAEIPDEILEWAIVCEVTGKPFKIIAQELSFYRQQNLPLPRRSPDQRHLDRFALRNPRRFWSRTCAKCGKEIQTTYAPDRPEIVYCESCYLQIVY